MHASLVAGQKSLNIMVRKILKHSKDQGLICPSLHKLGTDMYLPKRNKIIIMKLTLTLTSRWSFYFTPIRRELFQ